MVRLSLVRFGEADMDLKNFRVIQTSRGLRIVEVEKQSPTPNFIGIGPVYYSGQVNVF